MMSSRRPRHKSLIALLLLTVLIGGSGWLMPVFSMQTGKKASRRPRHHSNNQEAWLDLRRDMTLATIKGYSDTALNGKVVQIEVAHHIFQNTDVDGYAIRPQTLLIKHGKKVGAEAFHRGEQVYIIPPITEEGGGGNAVAIADNFADAVRALKQVTVVVTGSIHVTETVRGVVWLDTDKGKTLEVYIDPVTSGQIIPGGTIPPYSVNLNSFFDHNIQVRLLKQPGDGFSILDIKPIPILGAAPFPQS